MDPHSGHRLPVRRAEVIQQLRESGDEHAAGSSQGCPRTRTTYSTRTPWTACSSACTPNSSA
ncbi:hypothetical protein ACR6C2_21880 [Streptomyces sp. INA 01156]